MRYLTRFMGTLLGVGMLSLCARPAVAQTEAVFDVTTDALGSIRMMTDANQQVVERHDFLPFGEEWNASSAMSAVKFAGKERDAESGLAYLGARYYQSQTGRFTSPDPLGGHLSNPQTFNHYAYAGNNPLRFTDPTGLDFYLQCESESDTCHEGRVGSYVKSRFEATIITSASLADPKSVNTATVNSQGVMITSAAGVHQGIFINGTPAADIEGSGLFAGFLFHIDHNELQNGVLSGGSVSFVGNNLEDAIARLRSQSFTYFGVENLVSQNTRFHTHPYSTNFRFADGVLPEIRNYGPSPHFVIRNTPGASVPIMEFHVDEGTNFLLHGLCGIARIGC